MIVAPLCLTSILHSESVKAKAIWQTSLIKHGHNGSLHNIPMTGDRHLNKTMLRKSFIQMKPLQGNILCLQSYLNFYGDPQVKYFADTKHVQIYFDAIKQCKVMYSPEKVSTTHVNCWSFPQIFKSSFRQCPQINVIYLNTRQCLLIINLFNRHIKPQKLVLTLFSRNYFL